MESSGDSALVRRAQTGDRKAFAVLVDCYWLRVYRWLCGLTSNAHEAEDLAQDVFLKAWATLPFLLEAGSFRSWLFRIARNRLIDSRRSTRTVSPLAADDSAASRQPGPVATAMEKEGQVLLQHACQGLPEIYRAAYLLRTQEDLPYPEIAQVLDVPERTARWRVCKARHLLVKELGDYLDRKEP